MSEQRRQVRVIQFVVDDKADIDRKRRSIVIDADGVAVSAGPEFAIIDRHRITLRQGPGRGIAGNSRSDNRDPHSKPPCPLMPEVRCVASEGFSGGGRRLQAAAPNLRGPRATSSNMKSW